MPIARRCCACAGPYAQALLGISSANVRAIESELLAKHELLRPGFTRVSLPFFMSRAEVEYVVSAIEQVAEHGWKLLPLYKFNHLSGEWHHHSRFTKVSG